MRLGRPDHAPERRRRFRQAAIVYLHYAVLYEIGALVLYRRGLFPSARGPEWAWFVVGALVAAIVVWGLWSWQNAWFARAIWLLLSFRLPTLIEGAFFGSELAVPAGLYVAAGLVVLATMAAIARAAWDV